MKVLQLRGVDRAGASIELHPQLTVVTNLDPTRRAWLVEVLGRLAGGRDLSASGEVEAHGIRFDLDDATLAVLGLDAPVRAVVTAADLPGHDAELTASAARRDEAQRVRDQISAELDRHRHGLTTAVAERDEARRERDELVAGGGAAREAVVAADAARGRAELELSVAREERGRCEEALGEAVTALDRVEKACEEADDALERARNHRRDAIAVATEAAAAVEECRHTSTDLHALTAAAAEARARLEAATAAVSAEDPGATPTPLGRRLADLERRRGELTRVAVATGDRSTAEVAEALDALLGASSEAPPVVAAQALADTWRDLHQQIAALDAGVSSAERDAEERVAGARRAVSEAETEFNQPVLTPEQIAKVEAAHHAVLETQDRTEGRFGGNRARKRLEELRVDERRVLERLGFSTYADYMMSSSSRGVGPANRAVIDTARAALARAEEDLANLPGAADRVRRRQELIGRRDAVTPRVTELIGHEPTGPEAEDEMRELREPVAADEGAATMLAERLVAAGVDIGPEPTERDELVLLARALLAEERTAEAQRGDLTVATEALDRSIDALRRARERGDTEPPALDPLPELAEPRPVETGGTEPSDAVTLREARWAELETARAALVAAEAELARHHARAEQLAGLEAELARATEAEAAAAAALASLEGEGGDAHDEARSRARQRVAEAEAALTVARRNETEAVERVTAAQGSTGTEDLVREAEDRLAVVEAALSSVAAAEQETVARLGAAEAEMTTAVAADDALRANAETRDRSNLADDVEWALLARLAAVRAVGPGGSVPLVLDDPFGALHDDEVTAVLDRLVLVAGAVQVVVVSDRPAVAGWASAQDPAHLLVHRS